MDTSCTARGLMPLGDCGACRARRWPPDADSTQQVVCYPVGVQPAGSAGNGAEVSFIGALQVGLSGSLPSG